eukprot:g96.t1
MELNVKKESQDEFLSRLWADINDFTSSKLLEQQNEITSTFDEQRNRMSVVEKQQNVLKEQGKLMLSITDEQKNRVSVVEKQQNALEEQGKLVLSITDEQGKRMSKFSNELETFRGLLRRRGLIHGQLEDIQKKGEHELEEAVVEEEVEKPQTIGMVVKTMFFVYLYAFLIASLNTLLFAYLMTAKLTDWSGEKYGVPTVNVDILIYQFYYPALSISSFGMGTFQIASYWESGIKEYPDCKLFPYGLLEGFSFLITYTAMIMGIQYPLWYYGKIDLIFWGRIEFLLVSVATISAMLLGAKLRDTVVQCLEGKSSEDIIKEKVKIQKRRRSSQIDLSAIK